VEDGTYWHYPSWERKESSLPFQSNKANQSSMYMWPDEGFNLQDRPDLGRIEKWVLRKAFDDEEQPFLPKVVANLRFSCFYWIFPSQNLDVQTDSWKDFALQHILYRQKDQFSDGVGYSWIDGQKAHAASNVNAAMSI
jgi:asparagine synthase (glutamine-hydrolysing)